MSTQRIPSGESRDEPQLDKTYIAPDHSISPDSTDEEALYQALENMGIIIDEKLGSGSMGMVFLARLNEEAMQRQKRDERTMPNMRTAILESVSDLFDPNSIAVDQHTRLHTQALVNSMKFLGTPFRPTEKSGRFAIKIIPDTNPDIFERSFHEARTLFEMQRVKDLPRAFATMCIEVRGQRYNCICMEELPGQTMNEFLQTQRDLGTKLDVAALLARYCYHFSLHPNATNRDIKPDNIMIGSDGSVRGFDLGLVIESHNEDRPHHTLEMKTVGTPMYMAPEQVFNSDVTPKADVYSLGIMLAEMFIGKHPYKLFPDFPETDDSRSVFYVMQNLEKIITYLRTTQVINTAIKESVPNCSPETAQFIDQQLVPLLYELIQYDPSDRWGLDQISEHFRRISSFSQYSKDRFRDSANGEARLTNIPPPSHNPPGQQPAFIPTEDILDLRQSSLDLGATNIADTPSEDSFAETNIAAPVPNNGSTEEVQQRHARLSRKAIGTIVLATAVTVGGIASLFIGKKGTSTEQDPPPATAKDTTPENDTPSTSVTQDTPRPTPKKLGEQKAIEYANPIATGLKQAVLTGQWEKPEPSFVRLQGSSILTPDGYRDRIIVADMELITHRKEYKVGNALFPIPANVAGQSHEGSMVVAFLNGERIDDDRVTAEILHSIPDEENPNENAFYNVRFAGLGAGNHLSLKVVHHVRQPVYNRPDIHLYDARSAIKALIAEGRMSQNEWSVIERAFVDACSITQDGEITGIHWDTARRHGNRSDCGGKAGQLAKQLRDAGFEADVAEGSKFNTDLSHNIGNHAVVLVNVSGGILQLDPERVNRQYVGPLMDPYIVSTLGPSVDVHVTGQKNQPNPTNGFNLGHYWGVEYNQCTPIRSSTAESGHDSRVIQFLEEQLFAQKNQ